MSNAISTKRNGAKIFFVLALAFVTMMSFSCVIVAEGETKAYMTSARIDDDSQTIRVYVDGVSTSYTVEVQVWINGIHYTKYYPDSQYYSLSDGCIEIEMNRIIPVGSTIKISPAEGNDGLRGYIEIVVE